MNSKKLEETALWQSYQGKSTNSREREKWVREVYEAAVKYLLGVRETFKNYTLHDETHVLNVMDAIEGLLGNQIEKLSLGELELLIIASCLHDIGMVYTKEERRQWLTDEKACKDFLKRYYPELLGYRPENWGEDIQQRYLRILHPFRAAEVLENGSWKKIFLQCPLDAVPKRCILAVCQAHGQEAERLKNNADLEYLEAHETDPLFCAICAILLRLGDLLDFDDTRAPEILYGYVGNYEKSREEWDKHQASAGFRYFNTPSSKELERALIEHGQGTDFYAISRFGIGFLSCFLAGDYVEVSTLYFDSKKNKREEPYAVSGEMQRYGLRLQVTGLKGYYTLKNQAKQNPSERRFPEADFCYKEKGGESIEKNGYRVKPGTSIAIRLDPGRLGALELCDVAKECLCGSRVPVYYNNRRIGLTYEEIMEMVHEIEGKNIYELSVQDKQIFDICFPAV